MKSQWMRTTREVEGHGPLGVVTWPAGTPCLRAGDGPGTWRLEMPGGRVVTVDSAAATPWLSDAELAERKRQSDIEWYDRDKYTLPSGCEVRITGMTLNVYDRYGELAAYFDKDDAIGLGMIAQQMPGHVVTRGGARRT